MRRVLSSEDGLYTTDGRYYEAIIQIRPYNENVVNFILQEIKNKKNVFIAKDVVLKEGVNFYITSNSFAKTLGKQLKKRFKGTLKVTRTLFSCNRLTSENMYRLTVLFRLS